MPTENEKKKQWRSENVHVTVLITVAGMRTGMGMKTCGDSMGMGMTAAGMGWGRGLQVRGRMGTGTWMCPRAALYLQCVAQVMRSRSQFIKSAWGVLLRWNTA